MTKEKEVDEGPTTIERVQHMLADCGFLSADNAEAEAGEWGTHTNTAWQRGVNTVFQDRPDVSVLREQPTKLSEALINAFRNYMEQASETDDDEPELSEVEAEILEQQSQETEPQDDTLDPNTGEPLPENSDNPSPPATDLNPEPPVGDDATDDDSKSDDDDDAEAGDDEVKALVTANTRDALLKIAKDEKVEVESDDNKSELARKILAKRATA